MVDANDGRYSRLRIACACQCGAFGGALFGLAWVNCENSYEWMMGWCGSVKLQTQGDCKEKCTLDVKHMHLKKECRRVGREKGCVCYVQLV